MFKVKYVDYIMMLVRLDLYLIVSLFQHKCEVSETISTTTLKCIVENINIRPASIHPLKGNASRQIGFHTPS